jgi:AcrR family transcriptional regulator
MPVMPSTKEQIVRAAERLFAERGLDGVSLRTIGAAAGSRNNSVVQYHFGTKEQLVRAVFEFRQPRLQERRRMLIDERRPADLRGWVECQCRAVLEQSELDGSSYMRFVAMLYQHAHYESFASLPLDAQEATRAFQERVASYLPHLPEPLRSVRVARAMGLIVQVAANRERARVDGVPVLPFAVDLADLVDGMVGFLTAPVSPDALAALDEVAV